MNRTIAVVGTGYVGLVTGVALSEIGHTVRCIDIDEKKVVLMNNGQSPIYEPGLAEMMTKNIEENRLFFTSNHQKGFNNAEVIYIAVGTPENADGSANLSYIKQAAEDIIMYAAKSAAVVIKSTVPVGTNHEIQTLFDTQTTNKNIFTVVSNPEFLREGSALEDAFNGDRIVIGTDHVSAGDLIEEINKPFNINVYRTNIKSAELIKYAANAFLATKISFINEIANICEKLDANIEDVATGMGLDSRIGKQFLNAGIGYGGSCFPKDTKALAKIAENVEIEFNLLNAVIDVNNKQQIKLKQNIVRRLGDLNGIKIAVLGLSFKPNTDDMREAASIVLIEQLISLGAEVVAYDPIAMKNAKQVLSVLVEYANSKEDALKKADCALILTEWKEFKEMDLNLFTELMNEPIVFDGRNCFKLEEVKAYKFEYHSIGRPTVNNLKVKSYE